jgi:hypothetical protein
MNDFDLQDRIEGNNIRKQWYQEELYYCATDVVAALLDLDTKRARNYYHVLKNRLQKQRHLLPKTVRLKTRCSDGKTYLTDFMDVEGVELLHKYIQPRIERKRTRIETVKADEIVLFHPKVIALLENLGWQIEHHVRLASGNIIDIVAYYEGVTYLIECKPELNKSKLYSAVGQVLCYRSEYDETAIPTIACYDTDPSEYVQKCCNSLGIELIRIVK